ncbi:MAG: hypothetical protein U1F57_02615 [bacterium]
MKKQPLQKFLLSIALGFLLFGGVGCAQLPIYHDLTENDANEILVALQDRGIEAQKIREEKSQNVSWSIQVSKKDAAAARKVLVENNLPHKKQLGFSGICKEKGLIPTPEEEKCRKVLALKGEIINSLERIPGVIDTDVVLNIPDVSEFASESQPAKKPTASAVIRVRKNPEGMDLTEPKIQRFISNAVENLDPRDVSVVITYVQPPEEMAKQHAVAAPTAKNLVSVAGLKMDATSKDNFKIYALVVLVLLLSVSVGLVFSLLKMTKLRRELKVHRTGGGAVMGVADQDAKMLQGPEGGAATPQIPAAGQTLPKS